MLQKTKLPYTRLFAFLLAVFVAIGALFSSVKPVHAADGTIDFHAGPSIAYGDYFTSRMTFDGSNTAYCVEPLKRTPPSGTYSYDLLEKTSPLRKALYYLNGGYGYDTVTKEKYFQGWSDDNAYVIGHLAVAYIYAGNTGDTGAFHGAPQSFIDKTLEVVQGISELPAPPENFRAFLVPGNGNQTFAGSWYQVPNGWIELQKSSANPSISDGNGNYTLEGAKYGIYKGDKLIQTLTTDKNGYAKSKELEEGSYTVKEISAPAGFIVDATAHDVNVKPEETSTVKSSDIPQNNPISLILQKLDLETGEGKPQGNSSLANAEFTIKFYTELSDTDPATSGKKPVRTWVMKTNASGEMHFTKDYFVSGDEFYYASDKKTVCLPIGTVTIQETKAPKNYFLNETVFVQKITGSGSQESVSIYNASNVEEQVYRGGVKVQKRDLETQDTVSQGNATLAGATFSITTLNEQPVWVNGKLYQKDEMCLTIITDENGLASTEEKALPVGHYRIEETQAPTGYLKDGAKTLEFEITKDGEMVDLTSKDTSIATIVVFESVSYKEKEIAVHADIDDHEQSIYFPEIKTTAKDGADDDKEVLSSKEATIIDTVTYKNLIPKAKYKLVGILMDKETGKAILVNEKTVTAETEFSPKESDGSVDVTFTFDASELNGHDVVVFEKLFLLDGDVETEITSHEDIKDEGQTVKLTETPKEPPKTTPPVKTGDDTTLLPFIILAGTALLTAIGFGVLYFKKRKK